MYTRIICRMDSRWTYESNEGTTALTNWVDQKEILLVIQLDLHWSVDRKKKIYFDQRNPFETCG